MYLIYLTFSIVRKSIIIIPILQMIKLKCRELKQLASHTAGAGGPRTQPPHPGSVACMAHFLYDDCVLVRRKVSLAKPQGPPASLELFSLEVVVGCRWCSAVLSWSLKGTHITALTVLCNSGGQLFSGSTLSPVVLPLQGTL